MVRAEKDRYANVAFLMLVWSPDLQYLSFALSSDRKKPQYEQYTRGGQGYFLSDSVLGYSESSSFSDSSLLKA